MDVFVYGTLTDPDGVAEVLDAEVLDADDELDAQQSSRTRSWSFGPDATLRGLHRVEGRYPTLAPGGSVRGRVLRVDDAAVGALDAYEGVDRGLYVRVPVPYGNDAPSPGDGERATVAVYVGDPARLSASEAVAWPGDGDLADRVRAYVHANDVAVVTDDPVKGADDCGREGG
jgi:gamma-glutamylcyclotransferase (GGCT)/AIG2-like uncharacterized protein YtfP